MNLASVALQSVAEEKVKHAANATAGLASITVVPDWIGIAGGVAAICVSIAIFYHTAQKIRTERMSQDLLKMKLAREGRRDSDLSLK